EIHPEGEENLGTLDVILPTDGPGSGYWPTRIIWSPEEGSAAAIAPGSPTRIRAGSGCVLVLSGPDLAPELLTTSVCGIKVTAGTTTDVPLAGVVLTWDPERVRVDLPPTIAVRADGEGAVPSMRAIELSNREVPAADQAGLVLAGTYLFTYSPDSAFAADGHDVVLPPAVTSTVSLAPPDRRAVVRIRQPNRALPNLKGHG